MSCFNTRGTKYTIFTKSRLVLKRLKLKTCVTKEIYRCVGGVGVLRFCSCIHPASFHEISLDFYRVNYSYFEAQGFYTMFRNTNVFYPRVLNDILILLDIKSYLLSKLSKYYETVEMLFDYLFKEIIHERKNMQDSLKNEDSAIEGLLK